MVIGDGTASDGGLHFRFMAWKEVTRLEKRSSIRAVRNRKVFSVDRFYFSFQRSYR